MAIEVNSVRSICSKCGTAYSRQKGYFPVSYAILHKGVGHTHVCKECIDKLYNEYLAQCHNAPDAVRQVCRKLDLYWSEKAYRQVEKKSTTRSMMTQYIAKINSSSYVGKSYDDTLSEEGTLWNFGIKSPETAVDACSDQNAPDSGANIVASTEDIEISEDVIAFWGPGYQPDMYAALEQRRSYWTRRLPKDIDIDVGTEAIIRQICSLELDINRDRTAGRSVEKSVNALISLLGSSGLKPTQRKNDDMDAELSSTPLGVWLYRYEKEEPLPDIDDSLKDVGGLKKYIFTWMGHLCKMVGFKNGYTKLYEKEIERLRVNRPEYDGEDDEDLLIDAFSDGEENN